MLGFGLFGAGGLDYYNFGHILMILLVPALFCAFYFPLRKKSKEFRYKVLMITFLINGLLFVSYKIFMYLTYDTFVLLNELPLHLCNMNIILIPLALKTKNKFLFNYLYYVGTIGAVAAVVLFDTVFLNKPIYDYGVFIYFFYHTVLLVSGVLFATFGIFTPNLKGIFYALGTLLVLGTMMHLVNTLFRVTGACDISNYFYTYGMDGNPLLGSLKKLIPVNLIYMFPLLPAMGAVSCLMYLPFNGRVKEEKRESGGSEVPVA